MELKELTSRFIDILGIQNTADISIAIAERVVNDSLGLQKETIFAEYLKLCPDLEVDYLQKIHQFFNSDRVEKKQDFTPACLGKLLAALTPCGEWVLDCCAGSGSLTIQKWAQDKTQKFYCEELDSNVIPLLLFNLSVRNITGYVINKNVVTEEVFKIWKLEAGERYSVITEIKELPDLNFDCAISNPPYNIPWMPTNSKRFNGWPLLPPKGNANLVFVARLLENLKGTAAAILPCGVLDKNNEQGIREYLLNQHFIKSVIVLPDRMFESTSISVCVIVFEAGSNNTVFIDQRNKFNTETRLQKGELHMANRTYHKEVKVLTDAHIADIVKIIDEKIEIKGHSKAGFPKDCAQNKYVLLPSRYIEFETEECIHRPFKEIINDINKIIAEKNIVKITVNETIAKDLGLQEIAELVKQGNQGIESQNVTYEKLLDAKIEKEDYISLTKNKNEFKFENKNKECLSSLFKILLPMWKQHIFYLNEQENILLAELKDAMLLELMSGKLTIE